MKVFISWSGDRSRILAQALRDWLPLVLHYVEPWLSEADVGAGDRWAQEVAKELEVANFGVICITPENVSAPWVLFEAGALAKSMKGSKVVPLLFNLEFSDITGPLAQFQAKKVERGGIGEVILAINHAAESAIPDDRAKQLFSALWPEFESRLSDIPEKAPTAKHMRPQHEILEELVAAVRGLDARFREQEGSVPEQGPRKRRRGFKRFHPMMLEEMVHGMDDVDAPAALLLMAGLVRDDLPWLHELLVETYREVKGGGPAEASKSLQRLYHVVRRFGRGPFLDEAVVTSKEEYLMLRELPMMIDHFVHRLEKRLLDEDSTRTSVSDSRE